jgi:hypothetical protein
VLAEPVGLPTLSFYAGALAAGALLALAVTPPADRQDGGGSPAAGRQDGGRRPA